MQHARQIKEPLRFDDWGEDNLNDFASIASQYWRLEKPHQDKIMLSLFRVNQSQNAANDVEKAIDLGVALESLLLPYSQGQLRLQLRIIGAWLSAGDAEDRLVKYDMFNHIYELRSKAAHNGSLSGKKFLVRGEESKWTERQLLDEGVRLAKDCVRTYIRIGGLSEEQTKQLLVGAGEAVLGSSG